MESIYSSSTHHTQVDGTLKWGYPEYLGILGISQMREVQVGTSQRYPSLPLYITVNEP
jgi:hypothetical protein